MKCHSRLPSNHTHRIRYIKFLNLGSVKEDEKPSIVINQPGNQTQGRLSPEPNDPTHMHTKNSFPSGQISTKKMASMPSPASSECITEMTSDQFKLPGFNDRALAEHLCGYEILEPTYDFKYDYLNDYKYDYLDFDNTLLGASRGSMSVPEARAVTPIATTYSPRTTSNYQSINSNFQQALVEAKLQCLQQLIPPPRKASKGI